MPAVQQYHLILKNLKTFAIRRFSGKQKKEIMIVGVIKEIKNQEYRVAMAPSGAEPMVAHGHTIMIEKTPMKGPVSQTICIPKGKNK